MRHLKRRCVHHGGDGQAIRDERDRNAPTRIAFKEGARSIDRVDDEDEAALEALGRIDRLLREPAEFHAGDT